VGATSWWTVFGAEKLRANPENRRILLAEERIERGLIRADDGSVLARSRSLGQGRFGRRYPTGPLFAHAVGYSFTTEGRSGLERTYNDALIGRSNELVGVVDSLLGERAVGDDIQTTLSARAQQVAMKSLQGRSGAVVAMDVRTGAVRVMASTPSYDPDAIDDAGTSQLNRAAGSPLLNRATQGLYPPGSTFKVVTAAAAQDSGDYTAGSIVDGRNAKPISGVPLQNFGSRDWGRIDLRTALTNSVNTVWAEVGVELGRETMADYMERFGFYEDPPLDYPDAQMLPSGVRKGDSRRLVSPESSRVDLGRMAIGQGDLQASALQMATVAQTIGNRGARLRPYLVEKVIDPDGRTVTETEPDEVEQVISEDAAAELTAMMRDVVSEGTGTAAALSGVDVAGKTGTAELNATDLNQPWFIGFTPEVAVAVTVERQQGGTGGTIAAPIAKRVLETLGQ
nr:penicillin-binding protein 2 [Solirubrobacterales bacterium]